MKRFLAVVCLSLLSSHFSPTHAAEQKPNVLFIAVDDLNHWVGYLGRNKQTITPNLDKLAARGTYFTRSYCAAPVCNPSRAALMSGMRPSTTGVYNNNIDWRKRITADKCLPAQFHNAGYGTFGAGKIYHGGFDRTEEWDDYQKERGNEPKPKGSDGVGGIKFAPLDCKDEDLSDYGIADYGIEQLARKHEKPFFLCVGFHKPHMPWNVPQKWYDMHPLDKIELPPHREDDLADIPPAGVKMAKPDGDHAAMMKSGRWKEAVQGYLAAISYLDMNVGRLMDALDKSAYKDNTIIVFWGDHGWHLGEKEHWRKFALWEEATRTPFIWVVPGATKPGTVCERTVDYMSIYPTLLDLCSIEKPSHLEGKSIAPLLKDPKAAWDMPALTTHEFNNHGVRSEGWRYIRYANGDEELYDESKDPMEYTNLAKDTTFADKKEELGKWLPKENVPQEKGTGGGDGGKKKKGEGKAKKAKAAAEAAKEAE
ncbi:iduronate-2-sulfatase [Verrucomicrobiaceae bacterium SCGC AG-212-N21]|nr:iduronate-2-sulfatase [Verrucomicrobiaceae bacterium SCGC AG-212-N21]